MWLYARHNLFDDSLADIKRNYKVGISQSLLWVVNRLGKKQNKTKHHWTWCKKTWIKVWGYFFFFNHLYYLGQVTKPLRINFHLLIYIVMLIILVFPNSNGLRSSLSWLGSEQRFSSHPIHHHWASNVSSVVVSAMSVWR